MEQSLITSIDFLKQLLELAKDVLEEEKRWTSPRTSEPKPVQR